MRIGKKILEAIVPEINGIYVPSLAVEQEP